MLAIRGNFLNSQINRMHPKIVSDCILGGWKRKEGKSLNDLKGRKIYEKRKSRRGMCRKIFGEKKEEKKGKKASTNSWRKRNSRNEEKSFFTYKISFCQNRSVVKNMLMTICYERKAGKKKRKNQRKLENEWGEEREGKIRRRKRRRRRGK